MSFWTELLGDKLQTKDGVKPTEQVLAGKSIIGVYCSAHWCPPCRAFTPELATVYEEMVEQHPDFELVFVSFDRDLASFEEYYGEMPFTAVPFDASEHAKGEARKRFNLMGIPTLVFLDSEGKIITTEGREVVEEAKGDIDGIWATVTEPKHP